MLKCMLWLLNSALLFNAVILKAQQKEAYHILYEMEYLSDSTNENSITKETMELYTNGTQSLFRSYEYSYIDSSTLGLDPKRPYRMTMSKLSTYYLSKDFENKKIEFFDGIRLGKKDSYRYSESTIDPMQWHVTEGTDTINGYLCQKAYLDYGGRKWFAWFASEIPVFDGPYKFCNLPGLIVSIHDSTDTWRFSLVSLSPTNELPKNHKEEGAKEIGKEQFYTLKKEYRLNTIEIEEASGNSFFIFKSAEHRSRIMKGKADAVKKDNNWIELF